MPHHAYNKHVRWLKTQIAVELDYMGIYGIVLKIIKHHNTDGSDQLKIYVPRSVYQSQSRNICNQIDVHISQYYPRWNPSLPSRQRWAYYWVDQVP